jgi:hypothetical protein
MVPVDVIIISFTQGFCSGLDVDPTETRSKNSPFGLINPKAVSGAGAPTILNIYSNQLYQKSELM